MKKSLVILIFISCLNTSLHGSYVDSLKKALIQYSHDTSKTKTYVSLGYHYDGLGKVDSSKHFYNLAIKLSEKIADKKFKGMAYYYVGLLYQNTGEYPKAFKNFNISLEAYRKTNRLKRIGDIYNSIGVTHYYNGQYDSAIANYFRAIPYFEKKPKVLSVKQR